MDLLTNDSERNGSSADERDFAADSDRPFPSLASSSYDSSTILESDQHKLSMAFIVIFDITCSILEAPHLQRFPMKFEHMSTVERMKLDVPIPDEKKETCRKSKCGRMPVKIHL